MTGTPPTAGRCASCKHWEPTEGTIVGLYGDEDPEENWWGHEPYDEQRTGRWGTCGLIALPDYGETVTVPAFTQDGSDYKANLHCRDDFGCVLYVASGGSS